MATRKRSVLRISSLILCLTSAACTENSNDDHLSIRDINDDWDVERPSFPPDKFGDLHEREFALERLIWVVVGLVIFGSLIALCALLLCCTRWGNASSASTHARIRRCDSLRNTNFQSSSLSTITYSDVFDRAHIVLQFSNPESGSSNTFNAADRPPRYDDVRKLDLSGSAAFPEVYSSVPESPPPEYDEGNARRY